MKLLLSLFVRTDSPSGELALCRGTIRELEIGHENDVTVVAMATVTSQYRFYRDCYRSFISYLILEIFSLKVMNCRPSWIIEGMHVTSQVGSRKVFILTASEQPEQKTRFCSLSRISN